MKLELHWKIIIGLVLGLLFGVAAATQGWGDDKIGLTPGAKTSN